MAHALGTQIIVLTASNKLVYKMVDSTTDTTFLSIRGLDTVLKDEMDHTMKYLLNEHKQNMCITGILNSKTVLPMLVQLFCMRAFETGRFVTQERLKELVGKTIFEFKIPVMHVFCLCSFSKYFMV
jgi:hypothetical protein